jgi:hypothetical protein
VNYPYRFLKTYLSDRGLMYLADRIPWTENKTDRRTKHFINALKMRLLASAPSTYVIIARNEAHVRLASSMWYVCQAMKRISLVGVLAYLGLLLFAWKTSVIQFDARAPLGGALVPIATGFGAWGLQYNIEKSFHYQRTRELLHILELAAWMETSGKVKGIFGGLEVRDDADKAANQAP